MWEFAYPGMSRYTIPPDSRISTKPQKAMHALPLICAVGLYLGACELADYLLIRRRSGEVFPPKLGWRFLRWFGIAGCIAGTVERMQSNAAKPSDWPLWLYALLLLFWISWPRTVFVDSSGVSSCSLFGFRRRSILWGQVSRITSDWQEERLTFNLFTPIWTFMGTSVTVTSRDGISIQHGLVNRKQGLFLDALRRYVPPEAFDAGLYDWHPQTERARS
jgi:hypothetical protein